MGKPLVFGLVAALALVLLMATGVIPLDLGGGADDATSGLEDGLDLTGFVDAAGLEGRGTKVDGEDDAAGLDVEPEIPAEVRGSRKGGAVIRGRVVIADGGAPAKGVEVRLVRPDAMFTYLRAEPKGRFDLLEARTGRDGRFAFLDVTPSDKYVVRAKLDPYARASSDRLDLRGSEQIDLPDLELGPGGGISARVLHHDGKPAANVRVAITWMVDNPIGVILADADMLPEIEIEVKTGEDGRFQANGLEPGDKTIVLVAPSGASEVIRKVQVDAGDVLEAPDFTLSADGFIAGRVEWSDGTPIPGARVFAGPSQRAALRTVETKADGTFRLGWLPEGDHYGGIMVPDIPVKMLEGIATGTDDLVVQFPVPGSVKGRVVQQGSGAPVTRFSLVATQTDLQGFQERMVQTLLQKALGPLPFESEDGSFELPRLAAGTYMFEVTAPGFPKIRKKDIVVVGGEANEGVVIELPRGNVASGKVFQARGTPLAGSRLYVMTSEVSAKGSDLMDVVDDRDPDAVAGGDGSFELPPQAPGVVHLIVTHDEALPVVFPDVDLKEGDVAGIEITMPPAGAVEGLLLGDSGRPASNEQIYVLYPDGQYFIEGVDDSTGRFVFEKLGVGNCVVRWLSPRDHRNYQRVVEATDPDAKRVAYDELREDGGEHFIADGETLSVTITLPRRVRFSGQLHVDGMIPENGGVWVTIPEGNWGRWLECDENGFFETEIQSGRYDVWVPNSERVWTRDEVDIPDQREFARDFER